MYSKRLSWYAAGTETPLPAEECTGSLVSSREEILGLCLSAGTLFRQQAENAGPAFFLASIDSEAWIPRVVVVRQRGLIRGIVYAKERKFAGFATGLMYVDATLGSMIVSAAEDRTEILKIAIARLLQQRTIRGLRVLVPRNQEFGSALEAFQSCKSMDMHSSDVKNHCVLDLTSSYENFLARMGKTTRRNFRYYRRRFEAAGHQYVPKMSLEEFRGAASHLLRKNVVGGSAPGLSRALRMLAAAQLPMLAGLRDSKGEWLAIVGGWYEEGRAVVFCQMNNEVEHPQSSLCGVLRGYLIESLISQSFAEVLFWAGVGGPLLRHCEYLPTTGIYFDRPTLLWRLFRNLFAAAAKFLPEHLCTFAQWISPGAAANSQEA